MMAPMRTWARSGVGVLALGAVLAVVLAVLLAAVAPGSASAVVTGASGRSVATKSSPMSKKDFVKAADNICRQANILLTDLVGRVVTTIGTRVPTSAQLQAYVQQADPIFRQQLSSIRALVPPRADRKKVRAMLDTLEKEIAAVEAHPEQLVSTTTSPLFAKSAKLAHAYGFKVCGTSNL
jgi:hypothetical protein